MMLCLLSSYSNSLEHSENSCSHVWTAASTTPEDSLIFFSGKLLLHLPSYKSFPVPFSFVKL